MIRANIGPVEKNQISTGSGSLITSEGHILTCNHVIRGCSKIKVRLRIPGIKAVMWLDAQVLKADEKLDAAILKVDVQGFPALPMREAKRDTKVGEGVFHLGYPFGVKLSDHEDCVEPSLFQGHVSSLQTKNGMKRINVDMAAKRGCSGGPVFSKTDGSIIGILCGSQTEGDARLMEEINYVLPASYIWEEMLRVEE
jgi:serine protease Do